MGANDTNLADLTVTGLNTPAGRAIRDTAGNAVTFNAASVGNPPGTSGSTPPRRVRRPRSRSPATPARRRQRHQRRHHRGHRRSRRRRHADGGRQQVGTGTADGSGNFTITPTSGLSQGSNTVAVTATDAAGNTSPASNITLTFDSVAPTPTSIVASGAGITGGAARSTPARR